jgi:hypothetical protein
MTPRIRSARASIALALFVVLALALAAQPAAAWPGSFRPALAPRPGITWQSGVYSGNGPDGDLAFAAWRNRPIDTATDFTSGASWDVIENQPFDIPAWRRAPQVRPVWSMPIWSAAGGSLEAAARGDYNVHYAALARNLVAAGLGNVIIRLGWEFNGDWYDWAVRTRADAANYAAAWRQIAGTMQSVAGAQFGFDWCVTPRPDGVDPALAYPGDQYVTEIGADVYDWSLEPNETPAQRWNDIVGMRYGLAWQARFASSHRKPVSFPEWGLVRAPWSPTTAGGDDPAFVQHMYDWFATHNTALEDYFDHDAPEYGQYYALTSDAGNFPRASALYRQLW